jgi:hypothetical protein
MRRGTWRHARKKHGQHYLRLQFPRRRLYCRLTSRLGRRPDQPASRARWFPERGCGSARSKRAGVDPPGPEGFLLVLPSTSETDGQEACLAPPASNASRNRSSHARKARQCLASSHSMARDPRSRRPMARLHPAFRRGCANQSQDARGGPEAVLLRPRPTRCACPRALKRTASVPPRDPGAVLRWRGPATPHYPAHNQDPFSRMAAAKMRGHGRAFRDRARAGLPAAPPRDRIQEVAGPWPGCSRCFAGVAGRRSMDTRTGPEASHDATRSTRCACPRVTSGDASGPSRGPGAILQWPGPATLRGSRP